MSEARGEPGYVLGIDEEEAVRLGFQHRVWGAQAYAIWERAGFRVGQTLLDAGCGPGFATLDLAHLVGPAGRVVAVDESEPYLAMLRERLTPVEARSVDVRRGDIQALDLPAGAFDGAYTRWVLCFVPNPEAVVAGVSRALRPGGVYAIQDYFNYTALTLAPKSEAFDRVIRAVDKSWRDRGGDPDVAGRLPALCEKHGLRVREVTPHLRVARPGTLLWSWPDFFFRNFVPRLVGLGLITERERDEFDAVWRARASEPGAYLLTPPLIDIIAVKA